MTDTKIATVRLNAKGDSRAIRHGFPWVYSDELVLDRRTKALTPGQIACLEDAQRRPLGLVAVNPKSKIVCRMLDRDIEVKVDQAWFAARIQSALAMRDTLYDAPYYRLVHAEADGLPGVIIDRFGDLAVIQPNAAWADVLIEPLSSALRAVTGVSTVIMNGTGRTRTLEGLEETTKLLCGQAPTQPLKVPMNGAIYMADVMGGQKTGLFFDQRDNHAFTARLSKGANVLDVFSHVGGFGLAALAGGAESLLCVDGAKPALELAKAGAKAMGMETRFDASQGDAFKVLENLNATAQKTGQKFDVVICDPPAFAPSKQALDAGLRAYERLARLAAPLVKEGGYLVLCSCSHAAEISKFRQSCTRGIGRSGMMGQLIHTGFAGPDHPLLPQLAQSGYLKAVFFRIAKAQQ